MSNLVIAVDDHTLLTFSDDSKFKSNTIVQRKTFFKKYRISDETLPRNYTTTRLFVLFIYPCICCLDCPKFPQKGAIDIIRTDDHLGWSLFTFYLFIPYLHSFICHINVCLSLSDEANYKTKSLNIKRTS